MSFLTSVAVMALVTGPLCGGLPRGPLAEEIVGHAMVESGGDPLAIGINPDRQKGLPQASVHPRSVEDAVRTARELLASGRTIGLGLMQIDSSQLARHGLAVNAQAFEQCRNVAAGVEHYSADVNAAAIYRLASQRYNTGSFERGQAYARGVELAVQRVRLEIAGVGGARRIEAAMPQSAPVMPAVAPVQVVAVPSGRAPAWDVYASARPVPVQLSEK